MKFVITGKNINVTNALKDKIYEKVGRLDKFFHNETEVHATMSVQKNTQVLEVTIPFNRMVFKVKEANSDMYASIDKAVDSLERQIVKNKAKFSKKGHESKFKHPEFMFEANTPDSDKDEDVKYIMDKKLEVKPMSVDEAVLQLGILEHEFFMFLNSETKHINVIYKKDNGHFGLLEPDLK
jgi:putative sigma-54 modulation protein